MNELNHGGLIKNYLVINEMCFRVMSSVNIELKKSELHYWTEGGGAHFKWNMMIVNSC